MAPAKAAEILAGIGAYHRPISTANPLAQKFFDQGLTLIYGFNHDEAARSFERAAQLDPKAAMPWWGVALAWGPNYNQPPEPEREKVAWEAIGKAVALRDAAPQVESDYIDALLKRYSKDPEADRLKLARDYAAAMRELKNKYPDDLDAATLFAESLMNLNPWKLWSPDGKPAEGTEEIVATIESVLRRSPSHPGANHYYIHAVEASRNPERALPSAERLKTMVPAAGHLVHMPGHIYLRTGDFEGAAATNLTAAESDRQFIARTGVQGMYRVMYYSHNLHFIAFARSMQGRYLESLRAARQLRDNVAPVAKEMIMAGPFMAIEYEVLARFHRWNEILNLKKPDAGLIAVIPFWHYARAAAHAGLNQPELAEAERKLLIDTASKVPADTPISVNLYSKVAEAAAAELEARIARAKKDTEGEIAAWRKAVAVQDGLSYDEPPAWYYPMRESLGGALLRAGRPAEAEQVFRKDLDLNPRNPRSLYGLIEALKAQDKKSSLAFVEREFRAVWKTTEFKLTPESL